MKCEDELAIAKDVIAALSAVLPDLKPLTNRDRRRGQAETPGSKFYNRLVAFNMNKVWKENQGA